VSDSFFAQVMPKSLWCNDMHCMCLGRADEAPRIHTIRGARRRLGCAYRRYDGGGYKPQELIGIHTNMPGAISTRRFKGDPSENEDKKKKRRSSGKEHLTTNKVIFADCFQVIKNG
jgi:hypothetical protein